MRKNQKALTATAVAVSLGLSLGGCFHDASKDEAHKEEQLAAQETTRYSSVFKTKTESAELLAQCGASGGVQIDAGFDLNDNKTLDTDEVDKTYVVCNGSDGEKGKDGESGKNGNGGASEKGQELKVTQSAASKDDCPAGGTIINAGGNVIPLCNAASAANATDFAALKEMVSGFRLWMDNVETVANSAGDTAEQAEMVNQMHGDGLGQLLEAIAHLAEVVAEIDSEADGSYDLSNYLGYILPYDSVTGSITRTGDTLSIDSASFTMGSDTISLGFTQLTFPKDSGTDFELAMTGLFADSAMASFAPVDTMITLTSTENIVELRSGDLLGGELTVNIHIGSEDSPVEIATKSEMPIVFTGRLEAEAIVYKLNNLPVGIEQDEPFVNVKLAKMDGELSYEAVSVEMNAAYQMHNAEMFRANYTGPSELMLESAMLTVTDVSTDFPSATKALNYVFVEGEWGWTRSDFTIIFNVDGTFSRDWYGSVDGPYITFEDAVGYAMPYGSWGGDWHDGVWYETRIDYGMAADLPQVAGMTNYEAEIVYSDVDNSEIEASSTRFGHTPLYSFSASSEISGLVDEDGNAIDGAKIAINADRTGYSRQMGTFSVSLEMSDKKFTGHFPNPHRSNFGFDMSDDMGMRFSFSDGSGGLIRFNPINRYDYWGSRMQEADIFYNGNRYGSLSIDQHGDVIIYYSFDKSEELLISLPSTFGNDEDSHYHSH